MHLSRALTLALILASLATAAQALEPPAVCFGPGTSPAYAAEVTARVENQRLSLHAEEDPQRFQLGSRWSSTATDGAGLGQGDPITITWSYVPDGLSIPGQIGEPTSNSNLIAWLNGIYGNQATWHALFVQIFARWSELTGITYVFQPTDDGATMFTSDGSLGVRGDIRIGGHLIDGNSGVLAYNFFPNTGDMVIDSADNFFNNTSNNSLRFRNVLAHEHGHGMGLRHVCPVSQTKLMEPFVSVAFDGPQHDDILGANRHYGDRFEDNDTFGTATPIGAVDISPASLQNVSVDDETDDNFYSFTVLGLTALDVTVTPTGFTYLQGPQNANGSCTAGTNFTSSAQNDLAVEVLDTDGTTLLDSVDATTAGNAESLTAVALPGAGTYFLRVSGSTANAVQLYDLSASTSALIFADGFEIGSVLGWILCEGLGCPP